jgi:hypothetical protein
MAWIRLRERKGSGYFVVPERYPLLPSAHGIRPPIVQYLALTALEG